MLWSKVLWCLTNDESKEQVGLFTHTYCLRERERREKERERERERESCAHGDIVTVTLQRQQLAMSGKTLTPVTLDSFKAWKERKVDQHTHALYTPSKDAFRHAQDGHSGDTVSF